MTIPPICFHARDGRKMFAFGSDTDPLDVIVELAWAWAEPDRQSICDMKGCPSTEGSYCCDCHGIAYAASVMARKKMEALSN